MSTVEVVLANLWRNRNNVAFPYLLINDTRGYFAEVPRQIVVDDITIPVHVCANECALRRVTEGERECGKPTSRIIISRMQLELNYLLDLQARASIFTRTLTGTDLAKVLGVEKPRPMLDRLPISVFWGLAPFLQFLNNYSFERVLLASLLDDGAVLTAGWSPEQVLDKLWYDGCLEKLQGVLWAVDPEEKRFLEKEFLDLVQPWLDEARRAVVQVA